MPELKARLQRALDAHPFHPAWWLRGPHQQSFWGPFVRARHPLPFRLERWDTPDGDFLRMHFRETHPGRPWLLQLHGLEGSVRSFYVSGIARAVERLGWNVAVMEFRACGGEMNRAPRVYHMGETTDLDFAVRTLLERLPEAELYLSGVSLGGNVLAKWLGEQGARVPANIRAAAVVSAPFNPAISAPQFHEILFGFYSWNFLRTLVPKAVEKDRQYPGVLDIEAIKASRDFYAYDTLVTARLHGFEDAVDYWTRVGCHQFLPEIRVPTLLLSSADDPFNPPETLPHDAVAASPWLIPQFTTHGGHVGFVAGRSPRRARYWADDQLARFFDACHTHGRPRP